MKTMSEMEKVGYLHELDLLLKQAQEIIIKTPISVWKERGRNFRVQIGLQGFPFFFDSLGVYGEEKECSNSNAGVKIFTANPDLVMTLFLQLWTTIDAANLSRRMDVFSDTIRSTVFTAQGCILGIDNNIEVKSSAQIEELLIAEFMPGISNDIQNKIQTLIDKLTNSYLHSEAQNEKV